MSMFTSHMQASSGIKSIQAYTQQGREARRCLTISARAALLAASASLGRSAGLTRGEKGVWEERHEEEHVRTCVCSPAEGDGEQDDAGAARRRRRREETGWESEAEGMHGGDRDRLMLGCLRSSDMGFFYGRPGPGWKTMVKKALHLLIYLYEGISLHKVLTYLSRLNRLPQLRKSITYLPLFWKPE